jgi:catechol 2,3-dioxygenase-like lactoylglutathione lyase family enzyme
MNHHFIRWEVTMRGLLLFVCGTLVGVLIRTAIAQSNNPGVLRLNHVGVAVSDLDESLAFYTQTLGFKEAFRVTDEEGQVALAYLRVSNNTFVELAPATKDQPAGLTHFGIQVDDVRAVKAMYEGRGASLTDIFTGSTKAILSNIVDPQGVQIELSEYPPKSLPGQALAGQ